MRKLRLYCKVNFLSKIHPHKTISLSCIYSLCLHFKQREIYFSHSFMIIINKCISFFKYTLVNFRHFIQVAQENSFIVLGYFLNFHKNPMKN